MLRGDPIHVLPLLFKTLQITHLAFEKDTEPYAVLRDGKVTQLAQEAKLDVMALQGHLMYDPVDVIKKNGGKKPPITLNGFLKVCFYLRLVFFIRLDVLFICLDVYTYRNSHFVACLVHQRDGQACPS